MILHGFAWRETKKTPYKTKITQSYGKIGPGPKRLSKISLVFPPLWAPSCMVDRSWTNRGSKSPELGAEKYSLPPGPLKGPSNSNSNSSTGSSTIAKAIALAVAK